MNSLKALRKYIASIIPQIQHYILFNGRIKGGKVDLRKGLNKSIAITKVDKEKILEFWKPYLRTAKQKLAFDIKWFDVYKRTNVFGHKLEHYIPDSYYYAIVDMFLTDALNANKLDDKNLYDLYFHDQKMPETIARKVGGIFMDKDYKITNKQQVIEKCLANGNAIIKPAIDSLSGQGIVFWRKELNDFSLLVDALDSNDNLVIQDIIKQHKVLSDLNDSSVNTLRIVTLLWENDVIITTAVAIIGGPGAKTNHLHGGGIVCGIQESGQLMHTAFDGKLNQYTQHPCGQVFSDIVIPNYDKCVNIVKTLAPRFGRISKIANWDLTIDEIGNPILIEVNLTWGGSVQIAGGPSFGNMTKEILDFITNNV